MYAAFRETDIRVLRCPWMRNLSLSRKGLIMFRIVTLFVSFFQMLLEYAWGYGSLPNHLSYEERELARKFKRACREARQNTIMWACVCDYAGDDPAFAKVKQALVAHWKKYCMFSETRVPNFDTLACSYDGLTQLLAKFRHLPRGLVGFLNVAPIAKHTADKRNGNHPFYAVLLTNGRILFSPNSGYSLSLLRPYIVAVVRIPCAQNGEQFRSWQCFPEEAAKILRGDFRNVDAVFGPNGAHQIPEVPETAFARSDNYGNIKVRFTVKDAVRFGWKDGDIISIHVDGECVGRAVYGKNVHGHEGETLLSLAAGSGIIQADASSEPEVHLDMFKVWGNAMEILGSPNFEQIVELRQETHAHAPRRERVTA